MATSPGVDRHFRGRRQRKSWREGKTSGDATRKCSKGETVKKKLDIRVTSGDQIIMLAQYIC